MQPWLRTQSLGFPMIAMLNAVAALGEAVLQPWQSVTLDYSAANSFMSNHYGCNPYFPAMTAVEPIFDARQGVFDDDQGVVNKAALQVCGFALHESPSSVADWGDLEDVRDNYLPELRKVLRDAFGQQRITHMVFWNPKLRGEEWEADGNTQYERTGIASLVHLDTDMLGFAGDTDALARMVERNRVESLIEGQPPVGAPLVGRGRELADAMGNGQRFAIVNAWRNVDPHSPVRRAPLAVMATRYKPRPDGLMLVAPEAAPCAERSRWYTFPHMTSDEVLLFLQYDRSVHAPSDVWHCALPSVSEGDDARPRRSAELRALVVFDERVPHADDRFSGAAVPRVTRLTEEDWR